jgi:hypothetical protein
MCSVTAILHVRAPWLPEGVDIRDVADVAGTKFIKLNKTNPRIVRLLTGQSTGTKRPNTSIIDSVVKLRNARRSELLALAMSDRDGGDVGDLGLDSQPQGKRAKTLAVVLPEIVEIRVPGSTTSIKVMMSPPHSPLWVEASPLTINILHSLAGSADDDSDDDHHIDNSPASLHGKVIWCSARNSFRVRWMGGGKVKTKDFKATDEASKAQAEIEAKNFLAAPIAVMA